MKQVWPFRREQTYLRERQQTLFVSLLVGSLFGALIAKLHAAQFPVFAVDFRQPIPTAGRLAHAALFPALLAAALVLRRRSLFLLLFFGKGVFVSCTLCAAAASGAAGLSALILRVLAETLLPLPIQFYAASVWLCRLDEPDPDFWLFLPMLLPAWFGVLLAALLL